MNFYHQAFLAVVKREQEALEKERLKEQEERRKKKENLKRQKRILEAAFDGEDDEIRAVLKEVCEGHFNLSKFLKCRRKNSTEVLTGMMLNIFSCLR